MKPPLVLVLGTKTRARSSLVLAMGVFPLEVSGEGPFPTGVWPAGLAALAERVDAVAALRGWNETEAGRDAHRAAARAGVPCFFDLDNLRAWVADQLRTRAAAELRTKALSDADELPAGRRADLLEHARGVAADFFKGEHR